jgi:hypothetical protein
MLAQIVEQQAGAGQMERTGWCGVTLVVAAVTCLVASEIIGAAHASRDDNKHYTFAVSSGSRLIIQPRGYTVGAGSAAQPSGEILDCRRVLLVGDVRLGYGCRRS